MKMFCSNQLINQIKLKPKCLVKLVSKASICHKSELPQQNTYHWPYERRSYGNANFFLDPFTSKKFNENTKVIQIEGNVASGKEGFGRRLANELGMKYMPAVDLESYYINDHGYDYRALNPLLPERLRLCDWEMFHENPSRHSVISMQHILFKLRIYQYIKVIQHIFNTGQGVVLSRSVFTERVFVEAMHKLGWLPMGYLRGDDVRFYDWRTRYNYARGLTLAPLLKPHLTIYLDTPVEVCMERIKNSTNPVIANSRALIPEFLEQIDRAYKDVVLPKQDQFGHIIVRECPERLTDDEVLDMVDDMKQLDFSYYNDDTRFKDWYPNEKRLWYYRQRRIFTTRHCLNFFKYTCLPSWDIAGLGDSVSQPDLILRRGLFEGNVGKLGYFKSFNTDLRFQNFLHAYFDIKNFGARLDSEVRNDYV